MDIQGRLDCAWQAYNLRAKMEHWSWLAGKSEEIDELVKATMNYHRGDVEKAYRFARHGLALCRRAGRDKGLGDTLDIFEKVSDRLGGMRCLRSV